MISRVINGEVIYSAKAKGCRLISLATLPESHLIFIEKLKRKINGDCSQHMFRCIYQNLDYFSYQVKSYLIIFYYNTFCGKKYDWLAQSCKPNNFSLNTEWRSYLLLIVLSFCHLFCPFFPWSPRSTLSNLSVFLCHRCD